MTDWGKLMGTHVSETRDMPPKIAITVKPAQARRMKNPAVISSATATATMRNCLGKDSSTLSKPMWRRRSTARADP